MKDLKLGTINGIMAALAVMFPTWIISSSFNGSILGTAAIFMCGAGFGICVLIFYRGDEA